MVQIMKTLYFTIFFWLVVLLTSGSTQNAQAQFGLFDTVWTMNGLPQDYEVRVSPNDSLFLLWTLEKPQNGVEYVQRTRLFKTLTQELIWDTTGISFPAILSDNKTVISWDSNKIILRDLITLEPLSSVIHQNIPINGAKYYWQGVSEIDTSQYISGYINYTDIKAVSKKFNYRTGQTTITSDSLPYFAMTISEDGQYVAGVYYKYYWPDSINEIIEVRKIIDYSLVLRDENYYSEYQEYFDGFHASERYSFLFSKDNHYLETARHKVYDLITGQLIFEIYMRTTGSTFSNNNILFFLRDLSYNDNSSKFKAGTYDCENDIFLERDYPDSTNQLIFYTDDLVFDNNYVLCHSLDRYNKATNYISGFADVALLRLNFDLTSIQSKLPESGGILYPNPANMNITIKMTEEIQLQLKTILYDSNGKIVKEFTNNGFDKGGTETNYNVSDIPSGNYFLRIFGKDYSKTFKVIIVR